MQFLNFRKETSERSDTNNWVKNFLIEKTGLYYDSIEGCNQNTNNLVTHIMERARVDLTDKDELNLSDILDSIIKLEGDKNRLLRKIRFANCFGIPLTYVLYCNENEHVYTFTISDLNQIVLKNINHSFHGFSEWIKQIKGWVSKKEYREDGLPHFDKILRKSGTAWPTNIDCFVSDVNNFPCAILEFQNTKDYAVKNHSNNDWFLCKSIKYNDIRRWTSQEILRVQSGLNLFSITWSAPEKNFTFKQISQITIPELPYPNIAKVMEYQSALTNYINSGRSSPRFEAIANHYSSFTLVFNKNEMIKDIHKSPLTFEEKTFPNIYYSYKEYIENNIEKLNALSNTFIIKHEN